MEEGRSTWVSAGPLRHLAHQKQSTVHPPHQTSSCRHGLCARTAAPVRMTVLIMMIIMAMVQGSSGQALR